jgi:hypothetical protein
MVVECANGCLGYLAPGDEWELGGYEVGLGAWCRIAAGGPEQMVEAARGMVHGTDDETTDQRRKMVPRNNRTHPH